MAGDDVLASGDVMESYNLCRDDRSVSSSIVNQT